VKRGHFGDLGKLSSQDRYDSIVFFSIIVILIPTSTLNLFCIFLLINLVHNEKVFTDWVQKAALVWRHGAEAVERLHIRAGFRKLVELDFRVTGHSLPEKRLCVIVQR
jgi:hypothetical protein